jgi:hypothetical protein
MGCSMASDEGLGGTVGVPKFGSRCRHGSSCRHSSSKPSTPIERGGAPTQSDLARQHRPRGRRRPLAALPHGAVVHDPPQPLQGDQRHQHEHDGSVPHLHLRVVYLLQQPCTLRHPAYGSGGRAALALDVPMGVHEEAGWRVRLRCWPARLLRLVAVAGLCLLLARLVCLSIIAGQDKLTRSPHNRFCTST